jgi:hypothetical protein
VKDDFLDDSGQLQYPSYSPDLPEKPQAATMEPIVEVELRESTRNGADAAVRGVTPQLEENLQSNQALQPNRATSTATIPVFSTSQTQGRKFSHIQGSDYDDDSDMDFGTPVTSPVIIVPGPDVGSIDMLPPPVSPCPVSPAKCKSTDLSSISFPAKQNTPRRPRPLNLMTTPRAFTPSQVSQGGESTSTPKSSHQTKAAQPASDSDVVMMILESVARDHAEKAERVSPLNGFPPTSASMDSISSHSNKSVVAEISAPSRPHQLDIPITPLIVQEEISRPLPESTASMSSFPSELPAAHLMTSTTTPSPSAPDSRKFERGAEIGSPATFNSVASVSQKEKAGDNPVSSLENVQTNVHLSRPAPQQIPSIGSTSSYSEISSRASNLNDSSQAVQNQTQTTEYSVSPTLSFMRFLG